MVLFTFSDLMLFAAFLLPLLTYIDRYNKRKQERIPLAGLSAYGGSLQRHNSLPP